MNQIKTKLKFLGYWAYSTSAGEEGLGAPSQASSLYASHSAIVSIPTFYSIAPPRILHIHWTDFVSNDGKTVRYGQTGMASTRGCGYVLVTRSRERERALPVFRHCSVPDFSSHCMLSVHALQDGLHRLSLCNSSKY